MERRQFLLMVALVAALVAVACGAGAPVGGAPVAGSGTVVLASRPVSGVREVQLAGAGTLFVTQGAGEALTIEAEDNLLPRSRPRCATAGWSSRRSEGRGRSPAPRTRSPIA